MKYFFLIIILVFSFTVKAQRGIETEYLKVDGIQRQYKIYIPESYDPQKEYPLVFILHGGGGTAKGMTRFVGRKFNQLAEKEDFIAVYPNGYKKGWNDGARDTMAEARRLNIDDVGFFDAMLADIYKKVSVDENHIFACGISNGGFMSQRLAVERPNIFKSVAVVAANLSEDQSMKPPPEKAVPILFICGTADPLVPYNGGEVTVLKQKRGVVKSMDETMAFWKKVNGCSGSGEKYNFPDVNKRDGSTASRISWYNTQNRDIKVSLIKIENGGHTWPGGKQYLPKAMVGNVNRDVDASKEIWSFFKKQLN